jgi:hypothetical protein
MSITESALEEQRRRAAMNQSLFRDVNERIEDLAPSSFTSFVCECMNDGCAERFDLTIDEYERIRAHPNRFFALSGHELPEVERIVETTDRYVVVEKLGVGDNVAKKLDPRSRHSCDRSASSPS